MYVTHDIVYTYIYVLGCTSLSSGLDTVSIVPFLSSALKKIKCIFWIVAILGSWDAVLGAKDKDKVVADKAKPQRSVTVQLAFGSSLDIYWKTLRKDNKLKPPQILRPILEQESPGGVEYFLRPSFFFWDPIGQLGATLRCPTEGCGKVMSTGGTKGTKDTRGTAKGTWCTTRSHGER